MRFRVDDLITQRTRTASPRRKLITKSTWILAPSWVMTRAARTARFPRQPPLVACSWSRATTRHVLVALAPGQKAEMARWKKNSGPSSTATFMSSKPVLRFKIVILGEGNVGKTALLLRYCKVRGSHCDQHMQVYIYHTALLFPEWIHRHSHSYPQSKLSRKKN